MPPVAEATAAAIADEDLADQEVVVLTTAVAAGRCDASTCWTRSKVVSSISGSWMPGRFSPLNVNDPDVEVVAEHV